MKRYALTAALILISATRAESQSDSVLTNALLGPDSTSSIMSVIPDSARFAGGRQIGSIRLASSSGGFIFGMVLGGYSGYEIRSQNCDHCRNPTGDALLVGATIGGAVGAALGAAFLDLRSICSFNGRITRTLIGSAIGATASFIAAGGLDKRGRSAFFIPLGAVGGSLGTLGRCWKSRY